MNRWTCECGTSLELGMTAPVGVRNRHRNTAGHYAELARVRGIDVCRLPCPECEAEAGDAYCVSRRGNRQRYHKHRNILALYFNQLAKLAESDDG